MTQPPAVPEPNDVPPDPDRVPASESEARSLRRWLAVTAIWAVAASAIGIIALIQANEADEETANAVGKQLTRVQRDTNARLDSIEQDINELARRDDLTRLEQRVARVEDNATKAARDARTASDSVEDLETRVEDLEADADAGGPGNGNGNGNGGGADSP
jgi:hypothetical protein